MRDHADGKELLIGINDIKAAKDSNLNTKSFLIKHLPNKERNLLSGAGNRLISQM